jgi:predicted esterase
MQSWWASFRGVELFLVNRHRLDPRWNVGPACASMGAVLRRPFRSLLVIASIGCSAPASAPPLPRRHIPLPPSASAAVSPATSASATAAPIPWPPRAPDVASDWCLPGTLDALSEDACYALPAAPTRTLLVYLHGLTPPGRESVQKRNVQNVVANAARRGGVAALLPRGPTRAELSSPARDDKGLGAHRSWPTSDETYRDHARRHLERIAARRRALETLVGAPFERVFLAGSSAGAHFVAQLALRGDFAADGFAALSGGSGRRTRELDTLPKRRFYVGYGVEDSVGPAAEALAALLKKAGWPVRVAAHRTGHGAREVYLDEALAFFDGDASAPEVR